MLPSIGVDGNVREKVTPGPAGETGDRAVRLSAWLGWAAIASATSVLLGWWLDLPFLRSWIPGTRAMVVPSALLCMMAGASLALLAGKRISPWQRRAGRALAVSLLAFALLMFAAQLLGPESRLVIRTQDQRPAPDTSVSMTLLALALLMLDRRRKRVALAELFSLLAGSAALLILTGYLYDYPFFADAFVLPPQIGMAPNAAVTILALAIGVLAARGDSGLMATLSGRNLGGVLARRLLVTAMITIPVFGFAAARLQAAGAFPAPGAAVLGTIVSLLVIFAALLVLARRLDRTDIERTRAEAELRQWKEFFDAASFGAVFGSPDDRVLWHNDAFARMHCYEPGELNGRPLAEVSSEAGRATLSRELRKVDQLGHHRFESEHVRKDGGVFPVVVDASSVRDAQGRLVYRVAYVQDVTEEHAAHEAHARLAALVETAQDAIILTDLEGKVVSWNQAAERVYGYSADEMVGHHSLRLYAPDRTDEPTQLIEKLRRGESLIAQETECVRKDGTGIPISLTASPVRGVDGSITGISAISRDITSRRAAERALVEAREEVEHVERAALAVSYAIAQIPSSGLQHVLEVIAEEARNATDAAYAVVGLTKGAEQPFEQLAVSGASEEQVASVAEAMRSIGQLTIAIRDFDPTRGRALTEQSSVRAIQPTIASFLGVPIEFRDQPRGCIYLTNKRGSDSFTERDQRMVEALAGHVGSAIEIALLYERESIERARLQAILGQLPEGIIFLDANGVVAHENATALTFRAGSDPERPYDVRFPNGALVPLEELPLWRASQYGESITGVELLARTTNGELVPILVSAGPVSAETGPVGAVAIFRDIRALKELERLREEWASVIAHDLRQPLNVISLGADILRKGGNDQPAVWAERIGTHASRLNRMIDDLIDLSRLEARRLELRPERVRIDELVGVASAGLPALEGRTRIAIAADAEWVFADSQRLTQVLGNLLSNAVKYGATEGDIRIEARRVEGEVQVSVENHGPGIPADQVPLLFQRFTRTREARQSKTRGIGLGLYICKGLVEAHGGRIWVDSTPGDTTSFHFTIPEAKPEVITEPDSQREPVSA
jgi:PAS domain S-box-containing protein